MENKLFVITGASGHIGKRIAERLLAAGKRVRVIGRSADHLKGLMARGAEAAVASVDDRKAMTAAFQGAQAAFLMIPPNPVSLNFREWQKQVAGIYGTALGDNRVSHAVMLSSIGAQLGEGTGPILGLRGLEETLNAIPGLNVVHLRAAFFMENLLYSIPAILGTGMIINAVRPDLLMAMIATRDIAAAAADQLLRLDFHGQSTRELLGQRDLTMEEATRIFGKAIGKPDLRYMQAPYEAAEKAMTDMGMSGDAARLMIEMTRGFNEKRIVPVEKRSAANTTATSMEEFASTDFGPAFTQASGKAKPVA